MALKFVTDPAHPGGPAGYVAERGYDEKATVEARVIKDKVWFDDGYREAALGDTVKMSPEDFDALEANGRIEPEQVAVDRDARAKAREAKKTTV